jgi:hypothetical protein
VITTRRCRPSRRSRSLQSLRSARRRVRSTRRANASFFFVAAKGTPRRRYRLLEPHSGRRAPPAEACIGRIALSAAREGVARWTSYAESRCTSSASPSTPARQPGRRRTARRFDSKKDDDRAEVHVIILTIDRGGGAEEKDRMLREDEENAERARATAPREE